MSAARSAAEREYRTTVSGIFSPAKMASAAAAGSKAPGSNAPLVYTRFPTDRW